ncbi:MAG: hypothetical protein HFH14_06585 [Lachnospiraceae bacterium]|nr:hypothetical protein [Lachnospiraceae bacterium]
MNSRTTAYSPYADRSLVISDSYSINFIYDGMRVSVFYKDAGEENTVMESLNNLKFYEEILNQANYDRTKKEILDLKGQVTEEEKQMEAEEPKVEKPENSESEKNPVSKADKKSIKIVGKKTVKCGKSYKYKVRTNGLSGKVKWSVNNKNRAKIYKTGKLKALKEGTVKLTVKVQKYKRSIRIRIK